MRLFGRSLRDCLENSQRGRVGRLLITQSALEGAFLPGFAGSRDDESGLFQSFQTVSGSSTLSIRKEEGVGYDHRQSATER